MTFDLKLNENTMDATNENLNRHLSDGILVWRTRAKSLGIRPSFWYFCLGILHDC